MNHYRDKLVARVVGIVSCVLAAERWEGKVLVAERWEPVKVKHRTSPKVIFHRATRKRKTQRVCVM